MRHNDALGVEQKLSRILGVNISCLGICALTAKAGALDLRV